MAHDVVTNLAIGLEYLGHCITIDNYFISIPLFIELALKGIYAIGTVKTNYTGLPSSLKNTKTFKRMEQGHMEWLMHEHCVISCVTWKNKCHVFFLSIRATLIQAHCEIRDTVPRRRGAIREQIFTSLMLVKYTKHMRGMDVADPTTCFIF